jgi:phosphoserine phosphatase RsbU/P
VRPLIQIEPVGFFIFTCALGTIAVRRTIRQEKRLLTVEREMAAAREIQSSILPAKTPQVPQLKIAARYSPMTSVAGDFYDFSSIDPNGVGILVADVAGHGVPAALIASMVKVAFASQEPHAQDPSRVLSGLNQTFCKQLRGQYLTAAYVFVDPIHYSAAYSGAGHPALMIWRAAGQKVERYENNGFFLGFRSSESYPRLDIPLSPGDRLLLYTDGLLDANNHAGESFGDHIDFYIAAHRDLSTDLFADALLADLYAWTAAPDGYRQEDDLTLLVVDFIPDPGEL